MRRGECPSQRMMKATWPVGGCLSEDTPHRCAQQAKHGDMDDTGHDGVERSGTQTDRRETISIGCPRPDNRSTHAEPSSWTTNDTLKPSTNRSRHPSGRRSRDPKKGLGARP